MKIKPKQNCRWDLVALGEVMLRLDPGEDRIHTAQRFQAWEGGGEYNVARGLTHCFELETAIVTAFADNPVGHLIEGLIRRGGVDGSLIRWAEFDGIGRAVRNGLNFTERGFGLRAPLGCSDRGHTAVSQLMPGTIDWDEIFGRQGARWFHTGGIFCGLSETTPEVALEALQCARGHGTITSYDLNYRPSLWKAIGGAEHARRVNRKMAPLIDVLIGNEEDFSAALGFEVEGLDPYALQIEAAHLKYAISQVVREFPVPVVAATLRTSRSASRNDWGAICYTEGEFYESVMRKDLEILDRVGGGDSFASGFIYGFLTGRSPQWAVECGAAHGALAMTTPGDASMARLAEVLQCMSGAAARIAR
jgi:2-dehydro-3-deoxygluconokinase